MGESAAALLQDGVLIAAAEEERFTRHKHEGCFPIRSVRYCLESASITLGDVDHIAVFWQPWRMRTRAKGVLKNVLRNPSIAIEEVRGVIHEFSSNGEGETEDRSGSWMELFKVKRILEKQFGSFRAPIKYLDHHRCHAASTFLCSPFEKSVILTLDGAGEEATTTLSVGEGTSIRTLRQFLCPNSLGHFYSTMTGFLGFKMLDGEYKMMGLAPYSAPEYLPIIRKRYLMTDKPGSFRLNSKFLDYHSALRGKFGPEACRLLGEPRANEEADFIERHSKIAASAQAAFEEVVFDLARWAYEASGGIENLCVAGGCGLNATANGKLVRQGPYDRIYVPPAPHDAGGAVGAALLVWHELLGKDRGFVMDHAYYGPEYGNAEISRALSARGIQSTPVADEDTLNRRTVSVLTSGGVVAWFQGRMEFGPRALGSRSFLADPRNDSIRETINQKIKKRELFRPFAPSIKRERAYDYFGASQDMNFMNIIVPVKPERRKDIPAVTHVDGSARPQTVNRDHNPRYWNLLDEFEKETGHPVLLNTSFNIQEPIVCTPDHAIDTFLRSKVDALVIGDHVIMRESLPAGCCVEGKKWSASG